MKSTILRTLEMSLLASFVVAALLVRSSLAWENEIRTWTSGKFKIEAALKSVVAGKATLARKDGTEVEIDIKKLSADDQKYITDNPPEEEDNPFKQKTTSPTKPDVKSDSGEAEMSEASKAAKVDWLSLKNVPLTPTSDSWSFTVPIANPNATQLKISGTSLPPKSNFFESTNGIVVNDSGGRAVIGYSLGEPKPIGVTRVVLTDLAKSKTLVTATTPGQMAPLALNDKGTTVLMRRAEWGHGNADRLELWNLTPTGIKKAMQWMPHDDEKGGNRDIKWAAFLDEERFVTLGSSGKLVVWKTQTVEPIFWLQIDGGCRPALTPDRKLLAFSTGKQIGVLDIEKEEVVAIQATPHTPWPTFCFSPDGSRLACSSHGKILVWNFADGTLYRDISTLR